MSKWVNWVSCVSCHMSSILGKLRNDCDSLNVLKNWLE